MIRKSRAKPIEGMTLKPLPNFPTLHEACVTAEVKKLANRKKAIEKDRLEKLIKINEKIEEKYEEPREKFIGKKPNSDTIRAFKSIGYKNINNFISTIVKYNSDDDKKKIRYAIARTFNTTIYQVEKAVSNPVLYKENLEKVRSYLKSIERKRGENGKQSV